MSFSGDLYPTAGADVVMNVTGDLVRYNSGARQRLGIGSTNQALSVVGGLPAWKTLELAESTLTTEGDILYENSTPALARLGAGTSGYFLKTQGASNPPIWAAGGSGAWELLDSYDSSGANSSYTYTETLSPADYSLWGFTFQGDSTAQLAMKMVLNTDTSTNQHWMTEAYDSGTITVSENMGEDYFSLGSNVMFSEAIRLYGYIYSNPTSIVGGEGYIQYESFAQRMGDVNWEICHGANSSSSTGIIHSVTIETSTSTWTDGSMFRFYGLKTA